MPSKRILISFIIVFCAISFASIFPIAANAQVKEAQEMLSKLGYDVGEPDGAWGGKTRSALNAFQKDQGFPATRRLSKDVLAALRLASVGPKLPDMPWSLDERIGNTLIMSHGYRLHYSDKGEKILRFPKGKVIKKTWKKKADGTYCEYTFSQKKMVCGPAIVKRFVIYKDTAKEDSWVFFDKKTGKRRYSMIMVEGNKLKP